tara:strand:+ start:8264 stop:9082 length:819 start_codon:yes stop_codon:yes gene_type:complete
MIKTIQKLKTSYGHSSDSNLTQYTSDDEDEYNEQQYISWLLPTAKNLFKPVKEKLKILDKLQTKNQFLPLDVIDIIKSYTFYDEGGESYNRYIDSNFEEGDKRTFICKDEEHLGNSFGKGYYKDLYSDRKGYNCEERRRTRDKNKCKCKSEITMRYSSQKKCFVFVEKNTKHLRNWLEEYISSFPTYRLDDPYSHYHSEKETQDDDKIVVMNYHIPIGMTYRQLQDSVFDGELKKVFLKRYPGVYNSWYDELYCYRDYMNSFTYDSDSYSLQ